MKHILIVNDNKENKSTARAALGDTYDITAASAEQAPGILEGASFDMVLLDIPPREADGLGLPEKIRESEADIPVIYFSGDGDPDAEERRLEAGESGRSGKDALTGLWNRAYTEAAVNAVTEKGGKGALFMIDIDNFKLINDNYGHIEGDNTLKMFADTMRKYSGEDDILCRIGGDEFVMFLNGERSKTETANLAGDIISDICAKLEAKKFDTNSSVSVGIAQMPEDGDDFAAAYNAADKALYFVKQNGKNSYYFYSEQKRAENERGSTLVDLKNLRDMMSRPDSGKGAYQLDIDSFPHVYNFVKRFVERSGHNVQTILFTAYSDKDTEQSEIDTALDLLEKAIYTSLRRADVSTRYSSKQIIVILMDANGEDGDMVAGRIIDCFKKIYTGGKIHIRCDLAEMDEKTMG